MNRFLSFEAMIFDTLGDLVDRTMAMIDIYSVEYLFAQGSKTRIVLSSGRELCVAGNIDQVRDKIEQARLDLHSAIIARSAKEG